MQRRITVIQGHPDQSEERFCRALAGAYAGAAEAAGHEVRRIDVAALDFRILRSRQEYECGTPPPDIAAAQEALAWADHVVIVYPLWLGTMPALLKAFLEQVLRPGFANVLDEKGRTVSEPLDGTSARIVLTMGMPALFYRWYFGAHSLKSLERNILGFVGIGPIRESLIGGVELIGSAKRRKWLNRMAALGRKGE